MEASHVRLLVVVGLLVLVSIATVDRRAALDVPAPDSAVLPASVTFETTPADPADNADEIARIRMHLLRVERELLAADVSHLSEAQLANRMHQIRVLREYRERGVFPHNHEVEGRRTPVFIDQHGTHCAVGYLIARSGHEDLARRISETRNLALVPELVDIPELVDWLEETGITVDEAARIQPQYGSFPPTAARDETGYPAVTALYAGVAGGVVAWNLLSDRTGDRWWLPGAVGVASAATGLGLALGGASADDDADDIESDHIAINAGIGLIAGLVGTRTLVLGRSDRPTVGDGAAAPARGASLSLTPWSGPDGGAGLHLGLRF